MSIKKIKILVITILFCALTLSQASFAALGSPSSWDVKSKERIAAGTGVGFGVASAAVIGWAIYAYVKDRFDNYTPPQIPVIMTTSNNNLLSINHTPTTGKIVVKNASELAAEKFDIAPIADPTRLNQVTIDPTSTCHQVVAAGDTCEFKISFTGSGNGDNNGNSADPKPVTFHIGNETSTRDTTTVTTIDMPLHTFYKPYKDKTEARGINTREFIYAFANAKKNGENILFIGTNGNGV